MPCKPFYNVLLILCLGALGGCSLLPGTGESAPVPVETAAAGDDAPLLGEWPRNAPSQEVFMQMWQEDEVNQARQSSTIYMGWVARFYMGRTLVPGWLDITQQILDATPADIEPEVHNRMQALGRNIGGEWAKDNSVRRINTRMLGVWRDAFSKAISEDDVPAFLTRCEEDVASILNGELSGDIIAFERYYEQEFFF